MYLCWSFLNKIWKRVVPIHSSGQHFSVMIPRIVQLVLGFVINASCRLPHDIDVFSWNGEGFFLWDVQLSSMYIVMATYEVTTHATQVFTVFFFIEMSVLDHGHLVCVVHVYIVRTPHRHSSRAALSGKVVLSAFPWLPLVSLVSPCCSGSTVEPSPCLGSCSLTTPPC